MHHFHFQIFDVMAVAVIVGSYAQVIPDAAAVLAVVWYCIQIWESDTLKIWTNRPTEPPDDPTESGEQ